MIYDESRLSVNAEEEPEELRVLLLDTCCSSLRYVGATEPASSGYMG